jgi:cytochrome b561
MMSPKGDPPMTTPPTAWTRTARLLHWGMALAVLIIVPAGYVMAWTYVDGLKGGPLASLHVRASQVHHTLGLLIPAFALVRLAWRLRHPAPPLPQGTSALGPRSVQALLYVLLLLLPLTGWAALSSLASAAGYPAPQLWFFAHDGFGPGGRIPHIVTPKPWNAPSLFTYGVFARAHRYLIYLGGVLLLAHLGGALWHHFGRKDNVQRAMLGRSPR